MNMLLTLIIGFFSLIGMFVVFIIGSRTLHFNGILGQSDTFKSIDKNKDGQLSYFILNGWNTTLY